MVRGVFGLGQRGPTYNVTNIYQHKCQGHRHGGGYGSMGGWLGGMMITNGIFGLIGSIASMVTAFRGGGGYTNPYAYLTDQMRQPSTTTTTMQEGLEQLKNTFNEDGYTFSIVGNKYVAEKQGARTLSGTLDQIMDQLIKIRNGELSSKPDATENAQQRVQAELDAKVADENSGITKNDDGSYQLGNTKFTVEADGKIKVTDGQFEGTYVNLDALQTKITQANYSLANNGGASQNEEIEAQLAAIEGISHDENNGTYTINGVTVKVENGKITVTNKGGNETLANSYSSVEELKTALAGIRTQRTDGNDGTQRTGGNDGTQRTGGNDGTQRTGGTTNIELTSQQISTKLWENGLQDSKNISIDQDKKEITYKLIQSGEEVTLSLTEENLNKAIMAVKTEKNSFDRGHKHDSDVKTIVDENGKETKVAGWTMQKDQTFLSSDQQFKTSSGTLYEIVASDNDHLNTDKFSTKHSDKVNNRIVLTKQVELSHLENEDDKNERIPIENIDGRVFVKLDGDKKIILEDFLKADPRIKNADGYQYNINGVVYKLEFNEDGSTKLVKQ